MSDPRRLVAASLTGLLAFGLPLAGASSPPAGVVVEELSQDSVVAQAGVESGDLLYAWHRLPQPPANPDEAQGELRSVFDWYHMVAEEAPRGPVELRGRRGAAEMSYTVDPGLWETRVRPWIRPAIREIYGAGRAHIDAGEVAAASRVWGELTADRELDPLLRGSLWLRLTRAWIDGGEYGEAEKALDSALDLVRDGPARGVLWQAVADGYHKKGRLNEAAEAYEKASRTQEASVGTESLALAASLRDRAVVAGRRGHFQQSIEFSKRARAILERRAPESPALAMLLHTQGSAVGLSGDLNGARDLYDQALAIVEVLAPKSLPAARLLNDLGVASNRLGDLVAAASYFERSLTIKEEVAPDSISVASTLNNLGMIAGRRGELDRAIELHRRALLIRASVSPESLHIADSLSNLGAIAGERGDLDEATDFFTRALAIEERLAPGSLFVAKTLNRLGVLASRRGDLDRAEDFFQRALDLLQREAPESSDFTATLIALGEVARRRGDVGEAQVLFERSLEMQGRLAPNSVEFGNALRGLGELAHQTGELDRAEELLQRAVTHHQQLAPGGRALADCLVTLGHVARERGDVKAAKDLYERALSTLLELAPGSAEVAESLHGLGLVHQTEDLPLAEDYFRRTLDAIDDQMLQLGGSHEVRSGFRANFREFYRDAIDAQLALGRPAEAFRTLERSRARGFLEQLAERDTLFGADLPDELVRRRQHLAAGYDRALKELGSRSPTDDPDEIRALREELRRLRDEAGEIEASIRRVSPRLAALQYPRPLGLEEARRTLDRGTLMLSYSVGPDATLLFALSSRHELRVERLAIGEDTLHAQVMGFRRLIREARDHGSPLGATRDSFARALSDLLVEPVSDLVEANERLLIVADGPLHTLPWGALMRKGPGGQDQYLVTWRPVHLALSTTVYEGLRRLRTAEDARLPSRLVAFGDPKLPEGQSGATTHSDVVVRSTAERGLFDWSPLPASRREVEGIAALYPPNVVRIHLGADATEERAKALAADTRIVHFATHGHLDERFPLNSFLALSVPPELPSGRDNGLLQAWEVLEGVRLNADLVVLSACETGAGVPVGGEGLVGLTRAFQHAGARSVLATLWSVADASSAELMVRFYRHLRNGRPKDEALRAAQVELMRGPIPVADAEGGEREIDASTPYYWAAFQTYGDFR